MEEQTLFFYFRKEDSTKSVPLPFKLATLIILCIETDRTDPDQVLHCCSSSNFTTPSGNQMDLFKSLDKYIKLLIRYNIKGKHGNLPVLFQL